MSGDNVAEVQQEAAPANDGPREIVFDQPKQAVETKAPEAKTEVKAAGLEEEQQPEAKPKNGMQERMDEITRARREAEREAEYWKARAKAGDQPAPKADPEGRPGRDAYQSDEDYLEALADWKVDQRLSKKEAETTAKQVGEARATSWNTKLESARAEFSDHQAVLDACDKNVNENVSEALLEHEHGAKVAYELAKNPDLIDKLNGMSATQAAFEIAKIGAKFDKAPESVSPSPKPAAVSKAPAPAASKVGSSRSTAPSPEEMSMDDYVVWRNTNGAR